MKTFAASEKVPTFAELLETCHVSAVHLEIHDEHMTSDPWYQAWLAGEKWTDLSGAEKWTATLAPAIKRGVKFRRVRMISEPASNYMRWQYEVAPLTQLAAGEDLRWLPRRLASAIAIPANPYWVLDDRLVRFSVYGGDGEVHWRQFTEDSGIVGMCARAFEECWAAAIPHEGYRI
ncbi:DUF6879 family protein [Nonomuraea candida]|uniref:DUF6879 family protein n=1 Tax=Nonomuraea candida TaxID=359159 RepID=UPI0005B84AE7|nr:DUF6879 family protein [Nonomuraea candida]